MLEKTNMWLSGDGAQLQMMHAFDMLIKLILAK